MLKKLILALAVMSLAACAFNNDESGTDKRNKKLMEENARAADAFRKVEGKYQGTLVRDNGVIETIQISLLLLNNNSKGETNNDGSAQIQYKQKAAYTRISPASAPLTDLDVAYSPETGTLNILNSKTSSNDDVQTIIATIKDGMMTGMVKSQAGIIGTLNLKFILGEASNGGNGSDEEYYDRVRKELKAISGTYLGCVITTKEVQQRLPSYKAKMTLSVYEQEVTPKPGTPSNGPSNNLTASSSGKSDTTQPVLGGLFKRNYDSTEITKAVLTGIYRSDLVPATLTLMGRYPAANNGYSTVFRGSLSASGEYLADFTNSNGEFEGTMYFKRGQTYPAKCANVSR